MSSLCLIRDSNCCVSKRGQFGSKSLEIRRKEGRMENREDLKSILPYLPLLMRSSTLFWPSQVVEALKALGSGPLHSRVDSGELIFLAISDLRNSLCLSTQPLATSVSQGYALFFDEVMRRWIGLTMCYFMVINPFELIF